MLDCIGLPVVEGRPEVPPTADGVGVVQPSVVGVAADVAAGELVPGKVLAGVPPEGELVPSKVPVDVPPEGIVVAEAGIVPSPAV